MTAAQLFELADQLTGKPRMWMEFGPSSNTAFACVMFLGFERALRQYSAVVKLLRNGLCDDTLVLVRSLYELNVNLHGMRPEVAAEFIRFGRFQQARLLYQNLEDELKGARGSDAAVAAASSKLSRASSALDSKFSEFKVAKSKWRKSWFRQSVEVRAKELARDTGVLGDQSDYWVYRLGSLFTHNEPGALITGVDDDKLTADVWKELRLRRDKASKQGLAPILHAASIWFADIVGMAGPCIKGYERPWFDDAMQKILPALCAGDTAENG